MEHGINVARVRGSIPTGTIHAGRFGLQRPPNGIYIILTSKISILTSTNLILTRHNVILTSTIVILTSEN